MRRRILLAAATALMAVTLFAPASVSAASSGFSLDMLTNTCDQGVLTTSLKVVTGGGTSANKIEIAGGVQELRGGHWRLVPFSLFFDAKVFTANGRQHHMTAVWGPDPVESHRQIRVWWSIAVTHDDTVLWELDVHSLGCASPA